MMQSLSNLVWASIPLLKGSQFSYRLLILSSFFSSIIAGIVIKNINKKIFFIGLCLITVSTTILNWGNRKTILAIDDRYIRNELPYVMGTGLNFGPGSTIWLDNKKFKIDKLAKNHLEIISGQASIIELGRTSSSHKYLIRVSTNTVFRENTLYFPGWILKINNKIHLFEQNNSKYPGIIVFRLPK
ncbi:MAG: hypothetical protein AABY22_21810 [Nanoarchaeota archaeon]